MDSIQITEVNALHFLQAIEEAISDGFFLNDSIEGYPQLGFPLQVRAFAGDTPEFRFELSPEVKDLVIEGYDPIIFVLDFQTAVLHGFHVVDSGTNIDPVGLKVATMTRVVQKQAVVLDLEPKAVEATTEAPKPTKAPRKTAKKGEQE